jgi:flagellar biosynthesis GTPase FlhF
MGSTKGGERKGESRFGMGFTAHTAVSAQLNKHIIIFNNQTMKSKGILISALLAAAQAHSRNLT